MWTRYGLICTKKDSIRKFHKTLPGESAFSIATLEQAKQLSGGQLFVVNWIAGIVHAQLPSLFHQKKAAQDELAWCVANADKAPHAGWLREVFYYLGKLALVDGEQVKAQDYLR